MLITYADSMGKNIKELHGVLNKHYKKAVGGVHIVSCDVLVLSRQGSSAF